VKNPRQRAPPYALSERRKGRQAEREEGLLCRGVSIKSENRISSRRKECTLHESYGPDRGTPHITTNRIGGESHPPKRGRKRDTLEGERKGVPVRSERGGLFDDELHRGKRKACEKKKIGRMLESGEEYDSMQTSDAVERPLQRSLGRKGREASREKGAVC